MITQRAEEARAHPLSLSLPHLSLSLQAERSEELHILQEWGWESNWVSILKGKNRFEKWL